MTTDREETIDLIGGLVFAICGVLGVCLAAWLVAV